MAEHPHFAGPAMPYDAMRAAEHVVRYHCVRELCRGKRVLDVACGEGHGCGLLATWGASEVVGVDISADAIAVARQVFGGPGTRFIRGDACRLVEVLDGTPAFDLIVSFDTIEHVSDVPALLAGIKQYCAAGGTIVIASPNDQVGKDKNPAHTRPFSFDEFRSVTTAVLGPASVWLAGTPVQGQMLYPIDEARLKNSNDTGMDRVTECQELTRAAVIPAQPNIAPDSTSCEFYLGCWGRPIDMDTVVSTQSFPAFVEPWRALARLKQEHARLIASQDEMHAAKKLLEDRLEDLRVAKAETERRLADTRRRMLVQARLTRGTRLQRADREPAQSRADLQRLNGELDRWRQVQQSRTYRLTQSYVRSYSLPLIGPVLRLLRRAVGLTLRSFRTR